MSQKHLLQNFRLLEKTFTLVSFSFLKTSLLQTVRDPKNATVKFLARKCVICGTYLKNNMHSLSRFNESFIDSLLYTMKKIE